MRKAAIALAALALCVPPLRGQVPEGAPLTYDNVLYATPVWSREDPFALLYLASRTNYIESVAALGPRVTALEGGTNNWNTAYGWGDHAGLYKGIGWFPSWTEVTGKPATFPPETHQHDHTAITNPPWLTDIPPLDAVLAAGNVAGGSIAITNTVAGYDFRTEVYDSGLLLKVNGDTMLDVGTGGTGGIRANPAFGGGIYLGDNPVVYGISVNGGEALHGDVALSIVQAESDPVAMAALAGYQSAAYWPPNATASSWFTFTTNANEITITDYNIDGGTDVIIPDYINGWPVTTIGENAFFEESGVTSIGGAGNVVTVEDYAFFACASLASVLLPQAQTVGVGAFSLCYELASVSLPQAQTVGDSAFGLCILLSSVPLPQVLTVGDYAFDSCGSLASLYFDNDAPTIGDEIFVGLSPNQVTNYVTNPQATGWGERLGDMPVVRLPLYADKIYQAGLPVATEAHVAEQIAGKVDAVSGLASNLWLQGETIVSDSYTNLWWRNVYSNGWHWLVAYTNAPGGGE